MAPMYIKGLMYVVTILLWLSKTRTAPFHSILASWTTVGLELMVKFLGWRNVAIRPITTFCFDSFVLSSCYCKITFSD